MVEAQSQAKAEEQREDVYFEVLSILNKLDGRGYFINLPWMTRNIVFVRKIAVADQTYYEVLLSNGVLLHVEENDAWPETPYVNIEPDRCGG